MSDVSTFSRNISMVNRRRSLISGSGVFMSYERDIHDVSSAFLEDQSFMNCPPLCFLVFSTLPNEPIYAGIHSKTLPAGRQDPVLRLKHGGVREGLWVCFNIRYLYN